MLSFTLYLFGLVLVAAAMGLAAYHDLRSFKIPNYLSLLVILGFVAAYGGVWISPADTTVPFEGLVAHGVSAVLMFVLTLGLFAARLVGAGDAKFATALALWLGPLNGLPLYVFYMSLVGGVLGLLTLALRRFHPFKGAAPTHWIGAAQAGENRVPYGVAIAIGFLLTALQLGYGDIIAIMQIVENGG